MEDIKTEYPPIKISGVRTYISDDFWFPKPTWQFLDLLREKNVQRQEEWPSDIIVDELFRANELAEEVGEVCGAVKKLYRHKHNIAGNTKSFEELRQNLREEIGDVMICLDLLANKFDINIEEVTREKFNKTSEKNGLTTLI